MKKIQFNITIKKEPIANFSQEFSLWERMQIAYAIMFAFEINFNFKDSVQKDNKYDK